MRSLRRNRRADRRDSWQAGRAATGTSRFWTSTVWDSLETMRAFRNSGVHMKAMPKLLRWCDEASFVHWEQPAASAPEVEAAFDRLSREGKLSKVHRPSARHQAGHTVSDARPGALQQLKKIEA